MLRIQLPWPSDPDSNGMPRLLLEATVQAPFGPLRVMTTHLEYYSPLQRAAQVEAVRSRHAEAIARPLGNHLLPMPLALPPLEIHLYWHRQAELDPRGRWLREQVLAASEV